MSTFTSTIKANPSIEDPVEAAYWAGVEAGMRRFAWWRDGCEYVGSCGHTLKGAIRDMDRESGKPCWHPQFHDDDGVEYCSRCGTARDYATHPRDKGTT